MRNQELATAPAACIQASKRYLRRPVMTIMVPVIASSLCCARRRAAILCLSQRSDGLDRLRHLHCACPSASPPVGDPNVSCNVQYTTRLKGHDVRSDLTWPAGVMCGRLAGSLFVNASAVLDTGGCAAALGGASGTTSSLAPEQWAIMPCCSALSDI